MAVSGLTEHTVRPSAFGRESGMTILCVPHEMGVAKTVANRAIFMDGGRMIDECPSSDNLRQMAGRLKGGSGSPG